jgi:hypothetical protein
MIFFRVGVMYSGEYDVCDATYSEWDLLHIEVQSTVVYNDISLIYLPHNKYHRLNMDWESNHLKWKITLDIFHISEDASEEEYKV